MKHDPLLDIVGALWVLALMAILLALLFLSVPTGP